MAKGKYNQETVKRICDAIASHGLDADGFKAGGIGKNTFYRWLEEKEDFRDQIAIAKETFRNNAPKRLKEQAMAVIEQGLKGFEIKRTKCITRKLEHFNPNGDLKWYQEETVIEDATDKMPPAQWAVNKLIPNPPEDLAAAIKMIEAHGLKAVVKDVDTFRAWLIAQESTGAENNQQRALNPDELNIIRAQILGVEDDPA